MRLSLFSLPLFLTSILLEISFVLVLFSQGFCNFFTGFLPFILKMFPSVSILGVSSLS